MYRNIHIYTHTHKHLYVYIFLSFYLFILPYLIRKEEAVSALLRLRSLFPAHAEALFLLAKIYEQVPKFYALNP